MTKVILTGRTDLEDYFSKSGVFTLKKLNHTPFLVFIESEGTVKVQIVFSAKELITYPPETPVMGQWQGEWNSDFFQFTVGDYLRFLQKE
jgi:hypothetical protein